MFSPDLRLFVAAQDTGSKLVIPYESTVLKAVLTVDENFSCVLVSAPLVIRNMPMFVPAPIALPPIEFIPKFVITPLSSGLGWAPSAELLSEPANAKTLVEPPVRVSDRPPIMGVGGEFVPRARFIGVAVKFARFVNVALPD